MNRVQMAFTSTMAQPLSRRRAFGAAGATAAALSLRAARAQDATPETAEVSLLFVQIGRETTITPNGDGTITIAMTGVPSQTQYFSDRPVRIAGLLPTADFTAQFAEAFADALPNGSLVGLVAGADEELAMVVEIDQPVFDAASETLTYIATVLTEDLIDGRTFETEVVTALTEPMTLVEAALFIDSVSSYPTCGTGTICL